MKNIDKPTRRKFPTDRLEKLGDDVFKEVAKIPTPAPTDVIKKDNVRSTKEPTQRGALDRRDKGIG